MQYFDKNGKEIKAGMNLRMEDGSVELVYDTTDQYGNADLGINATNEAFLLEHPNWQRECYSLSLFNNKAIEVIPSEQEIKKEISELEPFIEAVELTIDYGGKPTKEEYKQYEAAIARRAELTEMLGDETSTPEMTMQQKGDDDKYDLAKQQTKV